MTNRYGYALIALLSLSVLVIALSGGQAAYAATTWDAMKNLSGNTGGSVEPQIAVSGNDVYVVWTDDYNGRILFRHSSDGGTTWDAKKNLSGNTGSSYSPKIAMSGSDINVAWTEAATSDIFFRHSSDGGTTWDAKKNLGGNIASPIFLEMAMSGSDVNVAWESDTTGSGDIFVRHSSDGGATWGKAKNISNNLGDSGIQRIAMSGSNVNVVWQDDTPGPVSILLRHSSDGGVTWAKVKKLSSDDTVWAGGPDISMSGSVVNVAWPSAYSDGSGISFRHSSDGGVTWAKVKKLSSDTSAPYEVKIAMSGSNINVVWSNYSSTFGIAFRHSSDGGVTWAKVKHLSDDTGSLGNPQIAMSGSNVNVVWQDNSLGNFNILLRDSSDGGATWAKAKNISGAESQGPIAPKIAMSGSNVYVVWEDDDVYFRKATVS